MRGSVLGLCRQKRLRDRDSAWIRFRSVLLPGPLQSRTPPESRAWRPGPIPPDDLGSPMTPSRGRHPARRTAASRLFAPLPASPHLVAPVGARVGALGPLIGILPDCYHRLHVLGSRSQ